MSLEDFGPWCEEPVFVVASAFSLSPSQEHKIPQILLDTECCDGIRQQGCTYQMDQALWGSKISLWGLTKEAPLSFLSETPAPKGMVFFP